MTHAHDVDIVERDGGTGPVMGFMLGIAGLAVILVIAFAVLWARPWDDGGGSTIDTPISNPVDVPNPVDGGTGGEPAPQP